MKNPNLVTLEIQVLVNNPNGGEPEAVRQQISDAIWEKAREESYSSGPIGWFHSDDLETGYVNIYGCKVSKPRIKKRCNSQPGNEFA